MAINWHYARNDLSEQFLDTFEKGSTNTLTLFAPRRMGKTEFVRYDLMPMAEARGYLPVYVSFWAYEKDPARCLFAGLSQAREQLGWLQKARTQTFSMSSLTLGAAGVSATLDTKPVPALDDEQLERLNDAFKALFSVRKPLLLCLDEVQHLATNDAFESLIYFLRTLIDTHRDTLKVVYTGSSRDGLQRLFRRRKAPLFQSSSQIDLPELGAGFVQHIMDAFEQATQRQLDFQDAQAAFRSVRKVPFEFRQVIDMMLREGLSDILQATQEYLRATVDTSGYMSQWQTLKPMDQAVLVYLIQNQGGLYQDESRARLARWLALDEVSVPSVQNAVNRLRGELIAQTGHGDWGFEDPQFKVWLMEQIRDGLLPGLDA